LSEGDAERFRDEDVFPDWDYMPGEGEPSPFEYKASDWGWLAGKLVAVDYSAPALVTADELAELHGEAAKSAGKCTPRVTS
jgi:hypothetical protein